MPLPPVRTQCLNANEHLDQLGRRDMIGGGTPIFVPPCLANVCGNV